LTETLQGLAQQYLSGLLRYLDGEGEAALQTAYEVGRRAIAEGLGGLEMVAIHQKCVAAAMRDANNASHAAHVSELACNFLAESLSPFEMALRGFQDANAQLSRSLEDLRAAKEELLRQHNRLLAANLELDIERGRYRDLFDFAPDGYLVTDLAGKIEEANRAAEILIGAPGVSLTGTGLLDFVVAESRAVFEDQLKLLPEQDDFRVQEWQFDIRSGAGVSFPATLSVRIVRDSSGLPVSLRWLLRDISDRQRIEEQRAQLLVREQVAHAQLEASQRFAFLAEIGSLLVASLDCEVTLSAVARRIVPYLADGCLIFLVERDQTIRLLASEYADSGPALGQEPVPVDSMSTMARILREGRGEVLAEPPAEWREMADRYPGTFGSFMAQCSGSLMLVPMLAQGCALGFIVLGAADASRYQEDHLALAEDLARRCALAVDNTRLYRAMIAERDKAAEASRAKDDFLGILGHELRNPLVPILGWTRNLKKDPAVAANSFLNQGVETLERNARSILRLADDCLDLVRISERKVALKQEVLDLNRLVQGCIEALRLAAQDKGLLIVSAPSSSSLPVMGDRTRLEQVMTNLLINAIKYTNSGGQISVYTSEVNGEIEVRVADNGIGIATEFLEQIFQPFRGGREEWLTADAGLGLGLAIARQIVEMHGGSISAASPGPGGGSTFYVRLRLAPAEAATSATAVPASHNPVLSGSICVLLIDDQQDVADLVKMELEALGYTVLTAADGQAGLDLAARNVPDVIVSDIKMPRMGGFEMIRSLRNTPGLASVPVIALTGLGMKKNVVAALAAGYDAHLNKPVEASELSAKIQNLVAQRRAKGAGS
jgi:PAS domain S-box-containing protein